MSTEQADKNMPQSDATPMSSDTQQGDTTPMSNARPQSDATPLSNAASQSNTTSQSDAASLSDATPRGSDGAPVLSAATLGQLERICERLGASKERSPQMAQQLVKRAGQLAVERGWSEAQALEYLLSLMLKASDGGNEPQSPL